MPAEPRMPPRFETERADRKGTSSLPALTKTPAGAKGSWLKRNLAYPESRCLFIRCRCQTRPSECLWYVIRACSRRAACGTRCPTASGAALSCATSCRRRQAAASYPFPLVLGERVRPDHALIVPPRSLHGRGERRAPHAPRARLRLCAGPRGSARRLRLRLRPLPLRCARLRCGSHGRDGGTAAVF